MSKNLTNPLDTLFETEQQTPMVEYQQTTEGELAPVTVEKDDEDVEIDRKIDDVYTNAVDTFQQQMQYAEIVEPRYAARNAEVAATYLNIALNAVSVRAKVKSERKKGAVAGVYAGRANSGAVVATLDDIMKIVAVDAETKVVK